jgi:glycosyltransferase involved in cell wall biosynthesis
MLPFGPNEAFFIPEICELVRRRHQVLIVPMRPRGPVVHEDAQGLLDMAVGVPLISGRVLAGAAREIFRHPLRATLALCVLFKSRNPRIWVKNLAVWPKAMWVAGLASSWGASHIHAQWGSTSSTLGLAASIVSGIPWSLTVHRWDIAENNLLAVKARSARFVRAIDRNGAKAVEGIIDDQRGKIRIIHMGVSVDAIGSVETKDCVGAGALRVVMAANMVRVKGHEYAIRAIRLLLDQGIDISLDLAGDGPLRAEMERLVADMGVEKSVTFKGVISHQELIDSLRSRRWGAALLPSVVTEDGAHEGIPVFLIEAMAAGLPVVATNTGGIPELLEGAAGMMVPERNATAIASALADIARSCDLRSRFGRQAARRVQESFTVEGAMDGLLKAVTETE